MTLVETRSDQMFPVLDAAQIETAKRFASGAARISLPASTSTMSASVTRRPGWCSRARSRSSRRDGLNHEAAITTLASANSAASSASSPGAATLAAGRAGPQGCTALPFDAAHLRALVVGSAEVGEIVMRAFILRRVGLIQEGGAGSVLVGRPGAPDLVRLQGFWPATAIPTPCSTPRPTRKVAPLSSASACSRRSCR